MDLIGQIYQTTVQKWPPEQVVTHTPSHDNNPKLII